ncbi:MAG: hypothetical protein ACJ74Z_10835 [Bryobacteraceae bacterium]
MFDVLVLAGRDLRSQPLHKRRTLLESKLLGNLTEPVRYSVQLEHQIRPRDQRFEGWVAKRLDSVYEAGQRSGAWLNMRVNRGQEFVIGGYTIGRKKL